MAALKNEHKIFIVTNLACYKSGKELQKLFSDKFKFQIELNKISYYNPYTVEGKKGLAQKWKDLFASTRKEFNESKASIPVANGVFRLQKMQEHFDSLSSVNNIKGAQSILVDAAKESGGAFTNKIEHSGEVSNKIIINGVIPDPKEWERVATLHIENMLQLVARMKEAANDGS
jgi:hypothetical protein